MFIDLSIVRIRYYSIKLIVFSNSTVTFNSHSMTSISPEKSSLGSQKQIVESTVPGIIGLGFHNDSGKPRSLFSLEIVP